MEFEILVCSSIPIAIRRADIVDRDFFILVPCLLMSLRDFNTLIKENFTGIVELKKAKLEMEMRYSKKSTIIISVLLIWNLYLHRLATFSCIPESFTKNFQKNFFVLLPSRAFGIV